MGWREDAVTIHETVKKKWDAYSDEDKRFLALSLGGEVGELQNIIKKEWRGDFDLFGPTDHGAIRAKLAGEMADIQILLFLLAECYDIDLDTASPDKIEVLLERWPGCRKAVEEARKKRKTP